MPKSLAAKMHTIDIYIHTNQTSYVQGRPIVQCCCKRYKCVANSNTPKCPSLDTLCAFEFNGMITCKFALAFLGALCVFRSRQVLSPSCVSRSAQFKFARSLAPCASSGSQVFAGKQHVDILPAPRSRLSKTYAHHKNSNLVCTRCTCLGAPCAYGSILGIG